MTSPTHTLKDPPGEGEVAVRARFSAISRGARWCSIRVPPSQYETMRCAFQAGDSCLPSSTATSRYGCPLAVGDGVDPARVDERVSPR